MEEEIKLIEENIDYKSLVFGYGDAELSEKLRNAIRHLIQAYKEDETVLDFLAEKEYKRDELYYRQALRCFL